MRRNWTTDEDSQLLEMLRLNCHRTVIAAALDRTDVEIRARIGMLKALHYSEIPLDIAKSPSTAIQPQKPAYPRSHAESQGCELSFV
jgi:hypothetical protein